MRRYLWLGLICLLAAGCGVETLSYPEPPPTSPSTETTQATLPDNLSSVIEAGVPGSTTTTLPTMGPGKATLNGTVLGPNGPVGGATVEADRLVGDAQVSTETTTAADGSWSMQNILGGRYRVRAWQPPSLALLTPQVFFLDGSGSHPLTLQLQSFTGPNVSSAIAPGVPQVGQIDNLLVQVTNPTVGSDGVERDLPAVGVSVTLTNGPQWQVYNGNPQSTGADGRVLFQVSCQAPGNVPLSVAVGSSAAIALQLPPCTGAPPTTTTTVVPLTIPCPTTTIPGEPTSSTTSLPFGNC